MKKTMLLMMFLILSITILLGCSSTEKRNIPQREEFQRMQNRQMDISEEEMQQMFEERQQKAIEVCQDKNEDDSCVFESPRGNTDGICKIMNENLVCTMDRPADRPMRQK